MTNFLCFNHTDNYQNWGRITRAYKRLVVAALIEKKIEPFRQAHGLEIGLVHGVPWDLLGALMENGFLDTNHSAFFFLELLTVYQSGHFPCGWKGRWPEGRLIVY